MSLPAIVYEREPGSASRRPPASYRRREPEKSSLHRVVRENLATFLVEPRLVEPYTGYPPFVEREFERFLGCGLLSRGFARLRCPTCGFERLVAFSCKGRICPSCWARRAADTAARLVENVLSQCTSSYQYCVSPATGGLMGEPLQAQLKPCFPYHRHGSEPSTGLQWPRRYQASIYHGAGQSRRATRSRDRA